MKILAVFCSVIHIATNNFTAYTLNRMNTNIAKPTPTSLLKINPKLTTCDKPTPTSLSQNSQVVAAACCAAGVFQGGINHRRNLLVLISSVLRRLCPLQPNYKKASRRSLVERTKETMLLPLGVSSSTLLHHIWHESHLRIVPDSNILKNSIIVKQLLIITRKTEV